MSFLTKLTIAVGTLALDVPGLPAAVAKAVALSAGTTTAIARTSAWALCTHALSARRITAETIVGLRRVLLEEYWCIKVKR